jgi:hypothetical protein
MESSGAHECLTDDPCSSHSYHSSSGWSALDGSIIIGQSEGVQVGNGQYQRNEFYYALSPHGRLGFFSQNREVVRALVDAICSPARNEHELNRKVGEAMERLGLEASHARTDRSIMLRPPQCGTPEVVCAMGVDALDACSLQPVASGLADGGAAAFVLVVEGDVVDAPGESRTVLYWIRTTSSGRATSPGHRSPPSGVTRLAVAEQRLDSGLAG